MGKIISVVGNLGAGKTTFVKLLCQSGPFVPYWEKPDERPFQKEFSHENKRWALANQMDFFIFRCHQELSIRKNDEIAVMDGGFDQDFHVFTRHIHNLGFLDQHEFNLCDRFYVYSRCLLPPPDLIIRLVVSIPTLLHRRHSRDRKTIDANFNEQEFTQLEGLLDEWLKTEKSSPILPISFEPEIINCSNLVDELRPRILAILFPPEDTPSHVRI